LGELAYNEDLLVFREAAPADRYQKLIGIINGQIMQLMADQTEAMPYIGSALLDAFQARVDQLTRYGEAAATFQRQHDEDATALPAARTLADSLTVGQAINAHTSAMALPLARGKAHYDLGQLRRLVTAVQADNPLLAYEYASPDVGIGLPQTDL